VAKSVVAGAMRMARLAPGRPAQGDGPGAGDLSKAQAFCGCAPAPTRWT
jgi:hypothetical protein